MSIIQIIVSFSGVVFFSQTPIGTFRDPLMGTPYVQIYVVNALPTLTPKSEHNYFLHNTFSKGWVARAPFVDR